MLKVFILSNLPAAGISKQLSLDASLSFLIMFSPLCCFLLARYDRELNTCSVFSLVVMIFFIASLTSLIFAQFSTKTLFSFGVLSVKPSCIFSSLVSGVCSLCG